MIYHITINLIHDDMLMDMEYDYDKFPEWALEQIGPWLAEVHAKASAEFPNEEVPLALDLTLSVSE